MVNISESAAQQINRLKSEDTKASADPLAFLRVKVVPGGCSGMSYKLDFDNQATPQDKTFEAHGTKIAVDNKSYLYIAGMTLDFEGGLNGKGFIFNNPNASKSCGCGSSFGI